MSAVFNLAKIAAAFAEAAVDLSRWEAAMEVTTQVTHGFGAALFPIRGRLPTVPYSRSMGPSFEVYVRDGWIDHDERYRGTRMLTRKGVVTDLDFATMAEISQHPYYREFLYPFWVALVRWSQSRGG